MTDPHDHDNHEHDAEHDHEHEFALPDQLIPDDGRKHLTKLFKKLKDPVVLEVFTQKGTNDPFNEFTERFAKELAEVSDKITASLNTLGSDKAAQYDVTRSPSLLITPEKYNIRFLGAPMGEESRAFIEALLMASSGDSGLAEPLKSYLAELDEERHAMVFVSPSCPYCPGQAINAIRCAVERPGLVTAECVETSENQDLAQDYNVGSVPHTVINDTINYAGLVQEERFVLELVTLKDADTLLDQEKRAAPPEQGREVDLVIVGAGPAGLAAGIYAARSGLDSVILEKAVIGGQVAITPVVENYPGFANIAGTRLMDIMAAHAREYATINVGEAVEELKVGKHLEVVTNKGLYLAKAVILTTGSSWKKLGIPGEDRFFGFGVHYCATCDGYMYKNKKVAMVGGGNTALTDALYLRNQGADVTLIHRRDAFRAEKHLQDAVAREEIPVLWNHVLKEIKGDKEKATSIVLENTEDGGTQEMELDGVFIAIGHTAENDLAQQIGLNLEPDGSIRVDRSMRTNIPRVYAAGDVTGGVRQIVTAIGEGSTAAITAFEDLANPYWKKG